MHLSFNTMQSINGIIHIGLHSLSIVEILWCQTSKIIKFLMSKGEMSDEGDPIPVCFVTNGTFERTTRWKMLENHISVEVREHVPFKILVRFRVYAWVTFGANWTFVLWNDSPFTMLGTYFPFEIRPDSILDHTVFNAVLLLFVTKSVSFKITPCQENVWTEITRIERVILTEFCGTVVLVLINFIVSLNFLFSNKLVLIFRVHNEVKLMNLLDVLNNLEFCRGHQGPTFLFAKFAEVFHFPTRAIAVSSVVFHLNVHAALSVQFIESSLKRSV